MRRCICPFLYFNEWERKQLRSTIFSLFQESENSLKETLAWSTDCGGTGGAPCWDSGEWSKGHPRSMDGTGGSQTYQYMHGIDHGRGSRVGVAEARKLTWLSDRGQESVCELRWMDLTTCDVSASLGAVICQIRTRKINCFVDSGPEVHVRCSEWSKQLCVKIKNKTKNMVTLNGWWPDNPHEQQQGRVIQVQVHRHLHRHVLAHKSRLLVGNGPKIDLLNMRQWSHSGPEV